MNILRDCTLCPRNCHVDRYKTTGFCKANEKLKLSRYQLHYWEEPCISGNNGSGTIFFSNCNLKCIFCQNKKISTQGFGKEITIKRLAEICLELQNKKANNINLVTPTHYVPQIIKAIKIAKKNGLSIPIVYNTSSYENESTISLLKDTVDIYLADLKYYDNSYGLNYSNCKNYFYHASHAIKKMVEQTGKPIFKNNLLKRGVIVRVLVLPGHIEDSKKILKYLYDTYHNTIFISIMNQYTPLTTLEKYPLLNNTLTEEEYDEIINYAYDLGIRNAFIQEKGTCKESFIPDFDILKI